MMANNLVPQEVLRAPTWYENALLNATTPYSKQTPAANALINATTNAQSSLAYPALQYAKGNRVSYKDIWNALTGNNTADWVDVMKEVLPKAQRKMPENVYVNPKMAGAMGTALNMLLDPTNFVPVGIAGEVKDITKIAPELIKRSNASSRTSGAVGNKALVPRYVRKFIDKNKSILDFGAGKDAAHAKALRDEGYMVTAHEFGDNFNPNIHAPNALSRNYDVVYASNVINTQSSPEMLDATLDQIANAVQGNGSVILNYPKSPRYMGEDFTADQMKAVLMQKFNSVERIGGTASEPVWRCSNDLNVPLQVGDVVYARGKDHVITGVPGNARRNIRNWNLDNEQYELEPIYKGYVPPSKRNTFVAHRDSIITKNDIKKYPWLIEE